MEFKVGQTVVYPHHGAAVIEAIGTRMFKGEERTFLTLKVISTDAQIMLPAANAAMVGLRPVVNQEGLEEVVGLLKEIDADEPSNWSRRFKANGEKIASGEIKKVAEVVRDLTLRERSVGLSTGEKRMLAKAREMLVSELALAKGLDETEGEKLVDEIMAAAYEENAKAGENVTDGAAADGAEEASRNAATMVENQSSTVSENEAKEKESTSLPSEAAASETAPGKA